MSKWLTVAVGAACSRDGACADICCRCHRDCKSLPRGCAVFVPLLVRSKYSAYHPYVEPVLDAGLAPEDDPGFVAPVLAASGLPDVGLKSALDAAIAAGEQDVYLPNDSHWGPLGHRLAAAAVLRAQLARGVLMQPPGKP